jgi:hypothetical protein
MAMSIRDALLRAVKRSSSAEGGRGNMVKYLRTGLATAAVLMASLAAHAADLSMTPIYQTRPSASAADWALADRWTIYRGTDYAAGTVGARVSGELPAPTDGDAKTSNVWTPRAGVEYTLLTNWGPNGEHLYVNLPEKTAIDPRTGTTTIGKSNVPINNRAFRVGGDYRF